MLTMLRLCTIIFLGSMMACSPTVPGDDGGGEGEGEGEDEEEPVPCDDNNDCRGGELCVDDVCVEVCDEDSDCDSAVLDICDLALGQCVQCLDDDQCRSDEACVQQRCVFSCDDDDDCDAGEACNVATGACFEAECVDDDECRGGFVCTAGVCVSILPVICEANAAVCEGNSVSTCNADGTGAAVVDCGDDAVCVEGACAAVVCEANDFGCDDDNTAFVCDSSGTVRELLACRADQYCSAGACRTRACAPDSVLCAGDSRVICDELGATATVEACADVADCDASDFGCGCRVVDGRGTCVERICEPGIGQCVGNGVRVCNESGSGFLAVTDCGANDCIEGRCLATTCTANTSVCSGDTLLTCEADGTGYRATTCAETCTGADGSAVCANQVCAPRATRCDAAGDNVLVCNDRGSAEVTSPCVDGFCANGLCRPEVCAPNSRRCLSSTSTSVCDARGASERTVSCGAGEVCTDGVCADEACVPQCGTRECGIEATCGTSCGACGENESCSTAGQCVATTPSSGHVLKLVTTWTDTDSLDFDTYLSRVPGAPMCDLDTCYIGTCVSGDALRPDWDGSQGPSAGDPVGVFTSDGEETLTLTLPTTSLTYRLGLHYDATDTTLPTATVRVRMFLDDVEIDAASKSLRVGDLWDGTTLAWNGTRVVMNDSTRTQADFVCDPSPGSCTADSECPTTQFCNGNFFIPGACVDGCRDNAGCDANENCQDGVCVFDGAGGVGDVCAGAGDCGSELVCGLFTRRCIETCNENFCFVPGFFGCCELTQAERGVATCTSGLCE